MAETERFEVDLPTDLAQFVHSLVGHGKLASEGDVVREAVRAFRNQESQLSELRALVKASIEDTRPSLSADEVSAHLDLLDRSSNAIGDHA